MKLLLFGDLLGEENLQAFLLQHGVKSDVASNVLHASELVSLYEYDALVAKIQHELDPVFHWIASFAEANRPEGLVLLSANDTLELKLRAFDLGVDDFLTVPYHPSELLARAKAVVRRKKHDGRTKIYFGNLVIDLLSYKVLVWDNVLKLTKKEYDILLHLLTHKDKVVSKTALAEYLWGDELDNMASYNFLVAHIKNLRKKLLAAKSGLDIQNSYGVGYQIIEI